MLPFPTEHWCRLQLIPFLSAWHEQLDNSPRIGMVDSNACGGLAPMAPACPCLECSWRCHMHALPSTEDPVAYATCNALVLAHVHAL